MFPVTARNSMIHNIVIQVPFMGLGFVIAP